MWWVKTRVTDLISISHEHPTKVIAFVSIEVEQNNNYERTGTDKIYTVRFCITISSRVCFR